MCVKGGGGSSCVCVKERGFYMSMFNYTGTKQTKQKIFFLRGVPAGLEIREEIVLCCTCLSS